MLSLVGMSCVWHCILVHSCTYASPDSHAPCHALAAPTRCHRFSCQEINFRNRTPHLASPEGEVDECSIYCVSVL